MVCMTLGTAVKTGATDGLGDGGCLWHDGNWGHSLFPLSPSICGGIWQLGHCHQRTVLVKESKYFGR